MEDLSILESQQGAVLRAGDPAAFAAGLYFVGLWEKKPALRPEKPCFTEGQIVANPMQGEAAFHLLSGLGKNPPKAEDSSSTNDPRAG